LKVTAIWLKENSIDQWPHFIEPKPGVVGWVKSGIENRETYLILQGNETIGTFRLQWDDELFWKDKGDSEAGYLHSFAIGRKLRGLGIGDKVMQWIEQECRSNNKLLLRLDCLKDNQKLRKYYTDRGFVECGETKLNLYEGKLFEKEL
jgi:GNAT superfamily N-acetyltransferase